MINKVDDLINGRFDLIELPQTIKILYNQIEEFVNSQITDKYFESYIENGYSPIFKELNDCPIFFHYGTGSNFTSDFFSLNEHLRIFIMQKIKSTLEINGWSIVYDPIESGYTDNHILTINIDIAKRRDNLITEIIEEK